MVHISRKLLLALVLLAATAAVYVLFLGKEPPPPVDGGAKKTANQKDPINLALYFVKFTSSDAYLVREVHQLPFTEDGPAAALKELISGSPRTEGAARVIPPDTKILGISVKDGLATVNFSAEVLRANVGSSGEALGIQSIVNTLTEFPQIQEVSFQVEGRLDDRARDWWGHVGLYEQPFRRNLHLVHEPAIWVSHPVPGQVSGVPLLVKGSARAYEGTVHARLLDSLGNKLAEDSDAFTGIPTGRRDFEMKLTFTVPGKGSGTLEVFRNSPRDGENLDMIKIPIQWP